MVTLNNVKQESWINRKESCRSVTTIYQLHHEFYPGINCKYLSYYFAKYIYIVASRNVVWYVARLYFGLFLYSV